jgi:hypothetical protein
MRRMMRNCGSQSSTSVKIGIELHQETHEESGIPAGDGGRADDARSSSGNPILFCPRCRDLALSADPSAELASTAFNATQQSRGLMIVNAIFAASADG